MKGLLLIICKIVRDKLMENEEMATYEPKWDDYYKTIKRLPRRLKKTAQFVDGCNKVYATINKRDKNVDTSA